MIEVTYLGLKATTPIELYFETKMKGYEEHFINAFATAGYTEADFIKMQKDINKLLDLSSSDFLKIVKEVAIRCDCLKEYKSMMQLK